MQFLAMPKDMPASSHDTASKRLSYWRASVSDSMFGKGRFRLSEAQRHARLSENAMVTGRLPPRKTQFLFLDRCFPGQLPPIERPSALRLWGEPKTALRLRKIAYHIAGLAKNFKKLPPGAYVTAISDWEDDLQ